MDGRLSSRLNVLLTEERSQPQEHWSRQLSRLLQPFGVMAYMAQCGRDAIDLAGRVELHAAVIDARTPLVANDPWSDRSGIGYDEFQGRAGRWLLELFRRLPNRPPVVVVCGRSPNQQQFQGLLRDALHLGVFSVVSEPVDLEQMLTVFRRLIDRQYRGYWPRRAPPVDN